MIEAIKKLFTKDKSIELQLIDVIKQQNEFIAKNINERLVYVDPQSGYTNAMRFDDKEKKDEEDEEEFEEPQDMTPEQLMEHMEGKQEEGKK